MRRKAAVWSAAVVATLILAPGCAVPIRSENAGRAFSPRNPAPPRSPAKSEPQPAGERRRESASPWHLEFGIRDTYTKLGETEELLDRRLEVPLRLDVLNVFGHPDTPLDRKTNFTLASFYLGGGRQEADWLLWTLYLGGGGGKDHFHQRWANANLEVDFHYAVAYTGLIGEFYPWGVPAQAADRNWSQRWKASRPFAVTGLETGYVVGKGRGHYSLAPLRIYEDHESVRDWVTSWIIGGGWVVPLDAHWALKLSTDYRFHFYRHEEYDSWGFNAALRYSF